MTTHTDQGVELPVRFGIREWLAFAVFIGGGVFAWQTLSASVSDIKVSQIEATTLFVDHESRLARIEATRFTELQARDFDDRLKAAELAAARIETLLESQIKQLDALASRFGQAAGSSDRPNRSGG